MAYKNLKVKPKKEPSPPKPKSESRPLPTRCNTPAYWALVADMNAGLTRDEVISKYTTLFVRHPFKAERVRVRIVEVFDVVDKITEVVNTDPSLWFRPSKAFSRDPLFYRIARIIYPNSITDAGRCCTIIGQLYCHGWDPKIDTQADTAHD